jgi:serine/threonine protein kinase
MPLRRNEKYKAMFKEIKELGERYGKVFTVRDNIYSNEWAIKKTEFRSEDEAKLLKEVQILYTIKNKFYPNIVWFFDLWLENNCVSMNGNKNALILYILMELCDTTLETVINQILNDSYICQNNTLALLGF